MDQPSTSAAGLQQALAMHVVPSSVEEHLPPLGNGMDSVMSHLPSTSVSYAPAIQSDARSKTGLVYDLRMMLHASIDYMRDHGDLTELFDDEPPIGIGKSQAHPEKPDRISQIHALLKAQGLVQRMIPLDCPEVLKEDAMLVHSEALWDTMQSSALFSLEDIKRTWQAYEHHSLYVNASTALAARLSCGGVIEACEAVMQGKKGIKNALAVVRPPGHHAEPDMSMGFCFLNNVAVAVKSVQRRLGVGKVMILDWDVHHGNGTQRAFADDPSVLYVSIHRYDGGNFYPCSKYGAMDSTGTGAGEGTSVNVPWPKGGFGDADYLYAFQRIVMPIAYEFAPELVIISAGFDAADGDQLGECHVTPACYAHMTHMLKGLAGGRMVVALEGGYDLEALSNSALAVARTLLGEELPELLPMTASDLATEVVYQVAKIQRKYWKTINVAACEPLMEGSDDEETAAIIRVPDLIKGYRAHHLYQKYGLFKLPIADEELDKLFPGQVLADEKVLSADTVVLFVHDFGNMQLENMSELYTDIDLERSRMVDASNSVVDWVKARGYGLIDVNVMKSLALHRSQLSPLLISKNAPKPHVALMRYIWDNFLDISDCSNIILVGFGSGCGAVMQLLNDRDIEERVRAIIQVGGMQSFVRPDPDQDEKRAWFRTRSKLYIPTHHPILQNERLQKRLATQITTIPEKRAALILQDALPDIESFVQQKLAGPAINGNGLASLVVPNGNGPGPSNGANGINGSATGLIDAAEPMDLS